MSDEADSTAAPAHDTLTQDSWPAKPNALIVGPMKAGTSWLYEYLKSRNDVSVPTGTKETFFFDDRFESKGVDWYLKHFQNAGGPNVTTIIEVAPTYFHGAELPRRVLETLGKIKIVVTLRDPAKRAFSLFQHMRRYGYTKATDFRQAVQNHPEMLASSRYAECLERWREVMGPENVSVLFMEDLAAEPLNFAADCCHALYIAPPESAAQLPSKVNVASQPRNYYVALAGRLVGDALRSIRLYAVVDMAKRAGLKRLFFGKPQVHRQSITPEERSWFIDQIADDIRHLETILNRDFSDWIHTDGDGH